MVSYLKNIFQQGLKKSPMLTNTTIYVAFYSAAEFSQQSILRYTTPGPNKPDYNVAAAARVVCVGSAIYGPPFYTLYKFLDKRFVGTSLKTVMIKTFAVQIVCAPPMLAAFFVLNAIGEGKEDIFEELRAKYWKTLLVNQTFWIPGQMVNFFWVPQHLRVVCASCLAFIWINVLCFIKRQKLESDKSDKLAISNVS